ncbi:MAG TPA: hypothetical protein VMW36_03850 [Patescibacteria group bacterium]|nr:hypothetical protein [Patescibacteria group bacterium]
MRMRIRLLVVLGMLLLGAEVFAQNNQVPAAFWKLPLIVREGIDDVQATVGDFFLHQTFNKNTKLDGTVATARYGKITVKGNTVIIPIEMTENDKVAATLTFFVEDEGKSALLTEVNVKNLETGKEATVRDFSSKVQAMVMFSELTQQNSGKQGQ